MEEEKYYEILMSIKEDVAEINTCQQIIQKDIEHHIKRTDLLELNLIQHEEKVEKDLESIENQLKPVQKVSDMIQFTFIALTFIMGVVGFLKSINIF